MAPTDTEINSHGETDSQEVESYQAESKGEQILQSLGRQSSIYSLTLDEFQNALCESRQSFGSMNMDEFLNSIWIAEENQAQAESQDATSDNTADIQMQITLQENDALMNNKGATITTQPSLPRQGSLSIPKALCTKTVDEVWSEIHNKTKNNNQHNNDNLGPIQNPNTAQKQPTFGEMTLEDFLVRAGIVREQTYGANPAPPQQPQLGMYQNSGHPAVGINFVARPVVAVGGGVNNMTTYHGPQSGMKRGINCGGKLGNGNGGLGGLGMGSPVSPVSPNGMSPKQVDGGNKYGLETGGMKGGGRKRILDGQVEKVVERRQRRMIKNRESAARSRARKQAYTVELEAELTQLREENARLKQALAELERKRKQEVNHSVAIFRGKYYEEEAARAKAPRVQAKSHKANEKLKAMRRTYSCFY